MKTNLDNKNAGNDPLIVDVDQAWMNVKERILDKEPDAGMLYTNPLNRGKNFVRLVAAVLVLVAMAWGFKEYVFDEYLKSADNTIATNKKELYNTVLADGTEVFLNEDSKLTYSRKAKEGIRIVEMNGEAFFNVAPDNNIPFVILTGNARIEVVGTSFNVNTRPENAQLEVFIESGKVKLLNSRVKGEGVLLEPGEIGMLDRDRITKHRNADVNYMAWRTRKLVFNETPLREVVAVLSKVYHSDIKLDPSCPGNLKYTAIIDNQPLDSVLGAIELTFSLNVKISKDNILLINEG